MNKVTTDSPVPAPHIPQKGDIYRDPKSGLFFILGHFGNQWSAVGLHDGHYWSNLTGDINLAVVKLEYYGSNMTINLSSK